MSRRFVTAALLLAPLSAPAAELCEPTTECLMDDAREADPPEPDLDRIAGWLRRDPEALAGFAAFEEAMAKADALAGRFEYRGANGRARTARLGGSHEAFTALDGALRDAADPANQILLYAALVGDVREFPSVEEFAASPTEVRMRWLEEARGYGEKAGLPIDGLEEPDEPDPKGDPAPQPKGETDPSLPTGPEGHPCVGGLPAPSGNGAWSDVGEADASCVVNPNGLFAKDPRNYQKHLGCIKDQAARGTCAAFAVASAMEAGWSMRHGQRINLSEQKLYFRGELHDGDNRDGLNVKDTLDFLAVTDATLPIEADWNYNPSLQRQGNAPCTTYCYVDSCTGYGEACSDTSHQGKRFCKGKDEFSGCGFSAPAGTTGVRIWGPRIELWDHDHRSLSVETMKSVVSAGTPVVVTLMVNDTFKDAIAGDGFIRYKGQDETKYGVHAMHLVAYVPNDAVAAWVPGAPLADKDLNGKTTNSGYFVARNSWGPCAGDGGYLYIPERWARVPFFIYSAVTVEPDGLDAW